MAGRANRNLKQSQGDSGGQIRNAITNRTPTNQAAPIKNTVAMQPKATGNGCHIKNSVGCPK